MSCLDIVCDISTAIYRALRLDAIAYRSACLISVKASVPPLLQVYTVTELVLESFVSPRMCKGMHNDVTSTSDWPHPVFVFFFFSPFKLDTSFVHSDEGDGEISC